MEAFYCSRRNMYCKYCNSYIFVFTYYSVSSSKKCSYITLGVHLWERQQKTLYVLSLVRSLGRINEKELVIIFSLTNKQSKYSFPFSLLKATMFLPIREKLWGVKAGSKPVWSSLTMLLIDSWNTGSYLLAENLVAGKGVPALQLGWHKWSCPF